MPRTSNPASTYRYVTSKIQGNDILKHRVLNIMDSVRNKVISKKEAYSMIDKRIPKCFILNSDMKAEIKNIADHGTY